jgi:transcriptional regulator with XRE-family HTH domain
MSKTPLATDLMVGARMRLRRKQLGLSQEKLGEKLGITFQQIQKYEKGTNRVGASRLQAMADVLGVPVGYFFEDRDPATVSGPEPITAIHVMREPGALELLTAYSQIADPALRKIIVKLARDLGRASNSGAATGTRPTSVTK